jgi:tryptophan-rich sensory protein
MDGWALGLAIGLCLTMILAEGALGGKELPRWLASLRQPKFYPPLWVWIFVAVATYVLQGVIAYRLLRQPITPLKGAGFAFLVALMTANVAYNVVLDRRRSPRLAYVGILWFLPLLAALQIVLFFTDHVSAALNLIYVVWVVGYDLPIMRMLWKLNK